MTEASTIAPDRNRTAPARPPERVTTPSPAPAPGRRPGAFAEPAVMERAIVEPQHMQALARANEVRLARAQMKREIASGQRDVLSVVHDCPWEAESMTLGELLRAQRRWGRARSRKLINSINLSEAKRLGSLTERQRLLLVAALEAKATA
ncbi:MAG: hypothetical protein FJW90_11905 [Actinobacteria bacterium]|nr:hypothetical protein [Actinomycetota bacterium]